MILMLNLTWRGILTGFIVSRTSHWSYGTIQGQILWKLCLLGYKSGLPKIMMSCYAHFRKPFNYCYVINLPKQLTSTCGFIWFIKCPTILYHLIWPELFYFDPLRSCKQLLFGLYLETPCIQMFNFCNRKVTSQC